MEGRFNLLVLTINIALKLQEVNPYVHISQLNQQLEFHKMKSLPKTGCQIDDSKSSRSIETLEPETSGVTSAKKQNKKCQHSSHIETIM